MRFGLILLALTVHAQVTYDKLLNAPRDPGNWMTYSGRYAGWRFSDLDQINLRT